MAYNKYDNSYNNVQVSSIQDIFKQCFPHKAMLEDVPEKKKLIAFLIEKVKEIPHLVIDNSTGNNYRSFHFDIHSDLIQPIRFELYLRESNFYVCVYASYRDNYKDNVYYIHEINEFILFCEKYKEAVEKLYKKENVLFLEYKKEEKIKNLKENAILSCIKELAEEEEVGYWVDKDFVRKWKLYIRLSHSERMEVDIPLENYQNTLQNLQMAIHAIKELLAIGLSIKLKTSVYMNHRIKWANFTET